MKLAEKIKNLFLYANLDSTTYKRISPRIQQENRRILKLLALVTFIILGIMVVVNTIGNFLNTSSVFYALGAAFSAVIYYLCRRDLKHYVQVIPVLVDVYCIAVYALSVGIATLGSLSTEPTVTFFVFLILLPLIFIGRPITFIVTNVVAAAVFIFMDGFKDADVYSRDVTNVIAYVIISGVVSTWLASTRVSNHRMAEDLEDNRKAIANSLGIVDSLSQEYHTLWVVDKETRSIKLIRKSESTDNEKALAMCINTPDYDEFFVNYIKGFVDPADADRVTEGVAFDTVMGEVSKGGIYSLNFTRRLENGTSNYHQVAFANAVHDGVSECFVIGFRNVDDIVKEEQAKKKLLQDALDAAEYANKAKTVFLNNMSHDIRTPMNAIVGFTALAASHIDNKDQVQDYLSKISSSSQHLISLINDVLDMSRIESGKLKMEEVSVHLPDVLHDLRTIIQVSVSSKQLNLFIDTVDVSNEDIMCDPVRLNQILINIVSNAVKFTPPGGYVSVRLIQKPSANPKYANYEFRIKDNGIGMTKEFAQHIFESFAREQNSTVSRIQGTGLGMAITKNIVDMMGGTIEVETEKGKGSEFIVNLSFRITGDNNGSTSIPELNGIHALVVDDDSTCCISVSEMLSKIGLRPEWTLSGHEAVLRTEFAKKQGDSFGVFIVDLIMPDMNGIETVRRIRKVIGAEAPIIVLTAYDWSDVEKEAIDAGVTAFCSKPIFISELQSVLSAPFRGEPVVVEEIRSKGPDFSGHRVLLVEDNEFNQEIAVELMEEVGLAVDVADDGSQAVRIMRDSDAGRYDLILMDIQMPIMDGYEATRQIRQIPDPAKASIPIVAMSANVFSEAKVKAAEAGMNGHLPKPIDLPALMDTLQKYLG